MHNNIVIAIDGASASGKTTNSKLVARSLGFIHVDTGAMYRTLAWYCLKKGVDAHDPAAVAAACEQWGARLECRDSAIHLVVDGYLPMQEIRTHEVTEVTPLIAKSPAVREWMKRAQRKCLEFGNLVMEGRDIGEHVFPEAPLKFYLDAHLTERTRRRAAQGSQEDIAARDEHDTRRTAAPLKIAANAIVIDTSKMTPAQSSELILGEVRKALAPAQV